MLRQTGRHAEARAVDRAALRSAPGGELRAHLLIGLAADAVGLADLRAVDAAVARIGSPTPGGWRAAVRLRWVRCERELLAGDPHPAAGHATAALRRSATVGARRHEAKSSLFLGVALADVASAAPAGSAAARAAAKESVRALRRAATLAARLGARPIAEVAGSLLGRPPARG